MTHLELATAVTQLDSRVNAFAEGMYIVGNFRGKKSEQFKYNPQTRTFVFNNNKSGDVAAAFDKVN